MPNSGYFDVVFATSGSRATVPDAIQSDGTVSYTQGYGPDYTLDPATNPSALYIEENKFNQLLYDVTSALQQLQQFSVPPFITTAMNNGTPFSYAKDVRVIYSGVIYQSLINSNTDTPPSANWAVADITSSASISGASKKLSGSWVSNTTCIWTADQIIVQDSSQNGVLLNTFSQTLNTATSGAGGLDTGTIAANTWYYVYAIYNGTTQNILMSLSNTAPTLPSGYTKSALIGTVLTDSSSHLVGFIQKDRSWQYVVGENLANLPIMASGSSGSVTTPTWTPVAVTSVVPVPIADKIKIFLSGNGDTCIAAPNNSYGAYNSLTNPPPLVNNLGTTGRANIIGEFVLESGNIYYASNATGSNDLMVCLGFEINI